jgi:hypothetical protein
MCFTQTPKQRIFTSHFTPSKMSLTNTNNEPFYGEELDPQLRGDLMTKVYIKITLPSVTFVRPANKVTLPVNLDAKI